MDLPPSTWLRLSDDASGDQRVSESHPVAHYFDYPFTLGCVKQIGDARYGVVRRSRKEFD